VDNEEERKAVAQLIKASRVKTLFAYFVSHDYLLMNKTVKSLLCKLFFTIFPVRTAK